MPSMLVNYFDALRQFIIHISLSIVFGNDFHKKDTK